MSPDALFWLAIAALVTACLAGVGAWSLAVFSRHELDELARRRNVPDRLGDILRGDEQAGLAADTLQVLANAAGIVALTLWLLTGEAPLRGAALVFGLAVAGLAMLAVNLWIPWAVARLWAEPFAFYTWPIWRALGVVLAPLVYGARFVDIFLHRLSGRPVEPPDEESFEEEIRTVVTQGHREGLLEEDARDMIEGIMELGEVDVSQIMTPRTDMVSMPLSMTWEEGLDFIIRMEHSRVPVWDKNRDDIVGILFIKDLLPELNRKPFDSPRPWSELLREPYFVPETKPVDVLLQEFQKTGNHMAVVLDEYGGVAGLVTLEDVLEEIVGEILDESDPMLVEGIKEVGDGVAEALGRMHIDEINERMELNLPEEGEYDTIAGFVFSELGHVPVVGEQIVRDNVRLTVLEATRRRIDRVRIEILDPSQQSASAGA